MNRINRLASIVVWRGFGFCWLAICTAMSGLIFDLALACRVGALLGFLVALVMEFKAETYHRIKRINDTEVWILLGEEGRPPKELARQLIVPAMRDELREKALYSAVMGGGLFAISVVLRVLLG
jgi:hypothetical protein